MKLAKTKSLGLHVLPSPYAGEVPFGTHLIATCGGRLLQIKALIVIGADACSCIKLEQLERPEAIRRAAATQTETGPMAIASAMPDTSSRCSDTASARCTALELQVSCLDPSPAPHRVLGEALPMAWCCLSRVGQTLSKWRVCPATEAYWASFWQGFPRQMYAKVHQVSSKCLRRPWMHVRKRVTGW